MLNMLVYVYLAADNDNYVNEIVNIRAPLDRMITIKVLLNHLIEVCNDISMEEIENQVEIVEIVVPDMD